MQESFTYFKIFKPISWGKRPAERRNRLIQRFLKFSQEIKKENAAQELPRGVTVSGSLADATSAASINSIRQEGQKSQEVFYLRSTKCQRNARRGHAQDCSLPSKRITFALREMTNAEPTTVGTITNGSQSLGGSAPAISSASNPTIRQEGQKSQEVFSKNRASLETCKFSNLHRARKKAASRLLFGDPLEVTNGLLTREKRGF